MNNNNNNVDAFFNNEENDFNQNEYEQPRYLDEQDVQDVQPDGYFA